MDLVRGLAQIHGVATEFWDWQGRRHEVSADSLLRVLEALGAPVDAHASVADVEAALREADVHPWRFLLPPCTVVRQGKSVQIPVHVPDGESVRVRYRLEDGRAGDLPQVDHWVAPREVDGRAVGRATFAVPGGLPLGWHRIEAVVGDGSRGSAPLIVVPERLDSPALAGGSRCWGVSAQLYAVRSRESWGVGDAVDLADLAALCAGAGAGFLLINPLHAAGPTTPLEDSPYLPATRRWISPLYIRPEAVAEFARLSQQLRDEVVSLRGRARQANPGAPGRIDRNRSWSAKRRALEIVYGARRGLHREAEYREFLREGGKDLADFALWCALVESEHGGPLPADVANAAAPGIDRARERLASRIDFYCWCQWVVREQLRDAQRVARALGMRIGIMADVAVGVHPRGADTWAHPEHFATSMRVGAPPDMYSQQGQDWSQPPWSPWALRAAGYRPLRDVLRAALATSGALRIDHILGLFRLWWIPAGEQAGLGTYVRLDHEALVGVLLLEAQRAGAVVVGEDLGTVEPWVRDYLRSRGVLGTSVLWFEKDAGGWPLRPAQFRPDVLAAVNTHDLPPTAGYLEGVQTALRSQLGLLVEPREQVEAGDREERQRVLSRLREEHVLAGEHPSERAVVEALYRYVCRTRCRLVAAALVDGVGSKVPENMPGTSREYPNWRIPLQDGEGREVALERLADNPRLRSLFRIMRAECGT